MQISQKVFQQNDVAQADFSALAALQPNLVLAFGSVAAIEAAASGLAHAFPQAHRAGCSTAGEISADGVADGTLVVTAIHFDTTDVQQSTTVLQSMEDSEAAGVRLAQSLPKRGCGRC